MKRFRVKETFRYTGWTYVTAATREEAVKKLENAEGAFDDLWAEQEWTDTDWDTLQEDPVRVGA